MQIISTPKGFQTWYFLHSDFKEWLDPYGMVHIQKNPNPPKEASENGTLFTPELWVALNLLYSKESPNRMDFGADVFNKMVSFHVVNSHVDSKGRFSGCDFAQVPWKKEDPSSHDNDTGIRSYSFLKGYRWHKVGRIAGRFWHPRDVIFYNWLKGGWNRVLIYPFWWLMIPIQAQSCLKAYKVRGERKIVVTDGKLLAWLRCQCTMHKSWVMKLSYLLCTRLLSRHTKVQDFQRGGYADISTWKKCFDYYFQEPEHPIRKTMALIYED